MKILLTGAAGFTGQHFIKIAGSNGHDICPLLADLTNYEALEAEILKLNPTHVVHLAGLSAVTQSDELAFYKVNLLGTLNLLKALTCLAIKPDKILLASSANIYGNATILPITEKFALAPINHYAMSKVAMEHMASTYLEQLPIIFARPFNYTGVGQDDRFLIPKLVNHFANKASSIQLGNIEVEREYNDVRFVCEAYLKLLNLGRAGEAYNVCSGRAVSINNLLEMLESITGHKIIVNIDPVLVRKNELHSLYGDASKLEACIRSIHHGRLEETLGWMLEAKK
jgi:nucleoside-diphosphate-sugar epimerase